MTSSGFNNPLATACNPYTLTSQFFADTCQDIQAGKMNGANYIWIVPLNTLTNVAFIVLSPLTALVNLIAAAVLSLCSLFAENPQDLQEDAVTFALLAGLSVTVNLVTHALSIGKPDLSYIDGTEYLLGWAS